jgi:galactose oxidase
VAQAYHIIASSSSWALTVESDEHGAYVKHNSAATSGVNDNWSFAPTSNGHYHVLSQLSGYAMTALGSKNGAKIVLGLPSLNANDDWCFVPAGSSGLYEVRNRLSGKSLDVIETTGQMQIWTYWGNKDQKYSVVAVGNVVSTPPLKTPAWLLPVETPVLAVAAANLADGRLLMWSSMSRNNFALDPSNSTWTAIYDPVTGG